MNVTKTISLLALALTLVATQGTLNALRRGAPAKPPTQTPGGTQPGTPAPAGSPEVLILGTVVNAADPQANRSLSVQRIAAARPMNAEKFLEHLNTLYSKVEPERSRSLLQKTFSDWVTANRNTLNDESKINAAKKAAPWVAIVAALKKEVNESVGQSSATGLTPEQISAKQVYVNSFDAALDLWQNGTMGNQ